MIYKLWGTEGGAKKPPINDKIDKNNDTNDIWDGLRDLKCTQKIFFTSLRAYLLNIDMFYGQKLAVWVHFYYLYDLW